MPEKYVEDEIYDRLINELVEMSPGFDKQQVRDEIKLALGKVADLWPKRLRDADLDDGDLDDELDDDLKLD
jgi:hypothetical protein